ncbi:DgyrCDS6036 [Dimorphilus gyrociliatus]|uniref:DgyrCDS6036 n=1 Tax=Dimorphilus gyrociliatus TaxID=2664684 RepID=A0A7I8VNE4_9ANNE|nr:DgyrCDS6036 [Dimorphilus gyrociliatus]
MSVCFVCGSKITVTYKLSAKQRQNGEAYFPFLENHQPPAGFGQFAEDSCKSVCTVCYMFLLQQWEAYERQNTPAVKRLYWLKRCDDKQFVGTEYTRVSSQNHQPQLPLQTPGDQQTFVCFLCGAQHSQVSARFIYSRSHANGEPYFPFLEETKPAKGASALDLHGMTKVCIGCQRSLHRQWRAFDDSNVSDELRVYEVDGMKTKKTLDSQDGAPVEIAPPTDAKHGDVNDLGNETGLPKPTNTSTPPSSSTRNSSGFAAALRKLAKQAGDGAAVDKKSSSPPIHNLDKSSSDTKSWTTEVSSSPNQQQSMSSAGSNSRPLEERGFQPYRPTSGASVVPSSSSTVPVSDHGSVQASLGGGYDPSSMYAAAAAAAAYQHYHPAFLHSLHADPLLLERYRLMQQSSLMPYAAAAAAAAAAASLPQHSLHPSLPVRYGDIMASQQQPLALTSSSNRKSEENARRDKEERERREAAERQKELERKRESERQQREQQERLRLERETLALREKYRNAFPLHDQLSAYDPLAKARDTAKWAQQQQQLQEVAGRHSLMQQQFLHHQDALLRNERKRPLASPKSSSQLGEPNQKIMRTTPPHALHRPFLESTPTSSKTFVANGFDGSPNRKSPEKRSRPIYEPISPVPPVASNGCKETPKSTKTNGLVLCVEEFGLSPPDIDADELCKGSDFKRKVAFLADACDLRPVDRDVRIIMDKVRQACDIDHKRRAQQLDGVKKRLEAVKLFNESTTAISREFAEQFHESVLATTIQQERSRQVKLKNDDTDDENISLSYKWPGVEAVVNAYCKHLQGKERISACATQRLMSY